MIYTLTINPALDRLIYLERFVRNQTNRPLKTIDSIGGKGTHVSLNLRLLGEDSKAVVLVGGESGKKLVRMLEEEDVTTVAINSASVAIRTNTIIVENSGDSTIIADKGISLSREQLDAILAYFREQLSPEDYLVLSGDARNGPSDFYADLITEFSSKGVKVFLDASGESLRHSLEAGPFLAKPNLDELSQVCGKGLSTADFVGILDALRSLEHFPVTVVALSLGSSGSILRVGSEVIRAYAPDIQVVNTIGCGDAYLAGLVYGFKHNLSLEETVILATAISSATAAHASSVGFDGNLIEGLKKRVQVERIVL